MTKQITLDGMEQVDTATAVDLAHETTAVPELLALHDLIFLAHSKLSVPDGFAQMLCVGSALINASTTDVQIINHIDQINDSFKENASWYSINYCEEYKVLIKSIEGFENCYKLINKSY